MSGDTRTGSIPVCGIGQTPQEYRIYGIPEAFFVLRLTRLAKSQQNSAVLQDLHGVQQLAVILFQTLNDMIIGSFIMGWEQRSM